MKKIGALLTIAIIIIVIIRLPNTSSVKMDSFTQTANQLYLYRFASQTSPYYVRAVNQTPYGLYDQVSNNTFLVYPAGIVQEQNQTISKTAATIIAYDHATHTWNEPTEVIPNQPTRDAHNVPQILIDDLGYLHVFHDAHANAAGIMHAVSKHPYDITDWSISSIPATAGSGYIAASRSANGTMYLFYRARLNDTGSCEGDACIPQALCTDCYEPEYYLKSIDRGNTWTRQLMIDPVKLDDQWNTVYVKSIVYDSKRDGVHLVFAVHKKHNAQVNRHYYGFFNFADDHLYAADGTDLGTTITPAVYNTHTQLYNYNNDQGVKSDGGNAKTTIVQYSDEAQRPHIFYSYCDGACSEKQNYIRQASWTGTEWNDESMADIFPNSGYLLSLNYKSDNDIDLYLRSYIDGDERILPKQLPVMIYHYDGETWKNLGRLFASDPLLENRYVRNMSFIQNANPELQATLVLPYFTELDADAGESYSAPSAIGQQYALGTFDL